MVNDEDEGPVDGQSGRKSGEPAGSTSDVITGLVNGHKRFLINLIRKQTDQWSRNE